MSLAFSRRSFLKYSAVAAVAVAGASLFSGCDQTDTKNLYCDGAGSITVLQINAVLGTYDDNAKKYKDIDFVRVLRLTSPSRSLLAVLTIWALIPITSWLLSPVAKTVTNAIATHNVTLKGLF